MYCTDTPTDIYMFIYIHMYTYINMFREERTENYPKDVLTQIKQSPVLSGMFDSPVVGVSLLSSKTSGYSEDRGERICEAVTQLTTPRHERNTRGEMRWIVNQPDNRTDLTQVVKVTKCRVGGKCYDGSLSSRDRTFCRQEYMDHKLVALNSDNSQVIIDTFSFPSCCTCYVQERGYSWW